MATAKTAIKAAMLDITITATMARPLSARADQSMASVKLL
jgi:hypothetical protein